MAVKDKPKRVRARIAFVWIHGARPIEYQRRIVRNRRTGRLEEIDIHELPPVDPGDEGTALAVSKGEEFYDDEPVVQALPAQFVPVED